MLLLDDVRLLHRDHRNTPYPTYLRKLLPHLHSLQYQDGSFIRDVCTNLISRLRRHAMKSRVYDGIDTATIIDKDHLANKDLWYIDTVEHADSKTGGSTGTEPFHYRRWKDAYLEIEGEVHYRAILREYNLDRPVKVLYLMLDQHGDPNCDTLTRVYQTNNVLLSHGMRQHAVVHDVVKGRLFYTDYHGFYESLLNYTNTHQFDVVLAPGHTIAALTWHIKRLKSRTKIGSLLSCTGSTPSRSDLDFLTNNGIIDCWCDHMRCWDGGATFFTCKHHTHHLLDGLAWVYEKDKKLVSHDFYSLPSPFVNYWNGDLVSIGEIYKRCECGRSYRPFKFLGRRSYAVDGVSSGVISAALADHRTVTKRADVGQGFIRIFTKRAISSGDRADVRKKLPGFNVNFVVEEDNG
jgi:hypothetical protein